MVRTRELDVRLKTMSKLRKIALIPIFFFVLQVLLVTYSKVIPFDSKNYQENEYAIYIGFGGPFDYIPILGLAPYFNYEPCRLFITDLKTNRIIGVTGYDIPYDIYSDYPNVWPNKE